MKTAKKINYANWLISVFVFTSWQMNGYAQTTPSGSERESEKIDIQKLEEKYWSAKDSDFSVVQNRTYTKAKKLNLSVSYGIPVNDAYSTGSVLGVTSSWYFNERHGVEFSYQSTNFVDNDASNDFKNAFAALPNQNRLRSSQTLSYAVVPFYAKMSFWDRSIVYFDIGFHLGVGSSTYDQIVDTGNRSQNALHTSIGMTQHLFFSNNISFRFDYTAKFSSQERVKYRIPANESESARSLGKASVTDTSLLFGLTFWL